MFQYTNIPFLKKVYFEEIENIRKKLDIKNLNSVPYIKKIVINNCLGIKGKESKFLEKSIDDITLISGQKPLVLKVKKSVSNFKIKKNDVISIKVTLRNNYMYDFLYKFINISIPRIKDFKGFSSNNFDYLGNFNIGLKDRSIFPELDTLDNKIINENLGYDINIVIKNLLKKNSYHKRIFFSKVLLSALGVPLLECNI
ncbi:large ribosomal subunit protein uL5 [Candidatus Vidania fulgoroideorum]